MNDERTKVVVRNLPWNLPPEKFKDSLPADVRQSVAYFDYTQGKSGPGGARRRASNTILGFSDHRAALECARALDGKSFVDNKGRHQLCSIEYAPFPYLPKPPKADPYRDSLPNDADFIAFCESLKVKVTPAPSAEKWLEEREKAELAQSNSPKYVQSSALLEELQTRRMKRVRRRPEPHGFAATARRGSIHATHAGKTEADQKAEEDEQQQEEIPSFRILYVLPHVLKKGEVPIPAEKITMTAGARGCHSDVFPKAPSRSICALFQGGSCPMGRKCKQIHVENEYWAQIEKADYFSPAKHSANEGEIHVGFRDANGRHGPYTIPASAVYITQASESYLDKKNRMGHTAEKDICTPFLKNLCKSRYQCNCIHVDADVWQRVLAGGSSETSVPETSTTVSSPVRVTSNIPDIKSANAPPATSTSSSPPQNRSAAAASAEPRRRSSAGENTSKWVLKTTTGASETPAVPPNQQGASSSSSAKGTELQKPSMGPQQQQSTTQRTEPATIPTRTLLARPGGRTTPRPTTSTTHVPGSASSSASSSSSFALSPSSGLSSRPMSPPASPIQPKIVWVRYQGAEDKLLVTESVRTVSDLRRAASSMFSFPWHVDPSDLDILLHGHPLNPGLNLSQLSLYPDITFDLRLKPASAAPRRF